jgi:hypothetical protein
MDMIKISLKKEVLGTFLLLAACTVIIPAAFAGGNTQLASINHYDNSAGLQSAVQKDADIPDGIDAATCTVMGNVPVIVEGPTKLEFWWRGSDSGVITFYVNGKKEAVVEKDSGWQKLIYNVENPGVHTIRWIFKKNG